MKKDGTASSALKPSSSPDFFNPLETYDFPRSINTASVCSKNGNANTVDGSLLAATSSSIATSTVNFFYLQKQHIYSKKDPLYENDDGGGKKVESVKDEQSESSSLTTTSFSKFYDIPPNDFPVYGQSITRLRKYGSCTGASELSSESGSPVRLALQSQPVKGKSVSALGLTTAASISSAATSLPVILRRLPHYQPSMSSNHSSICLESAEPKFLMLSGNHQQQQLCNNNIHQSKMKGDLYDVPRRTSSTSNNNPIVSYGESSNRPISSSSVFSNGVGMSIATTGSKDSLDCLYDVPLSSVSMKTYVNHIETNYDDVVAVRTRSRHDNFPSTSKFKSQPCPQQYNDSSIKGHRFNYRHNSTSSIFSAYSNSKGQNSEQHQPTIPVLFPTSSEQNVSRVIRAKCNISGNGSDHNELNDVPGRTFVHPSVVPSRSSTTCSSMNSSFNGGVLKSEVADEDPMQFYDVPSHFTKNVTLDKYVNEVTSSLAFLSLNSHLQQRQNSQFSSNSHTSKQTSLSMDKFQRSAYNKSKKLEEADVKTLPLGPKAAVSVCEKLKQEVVSSISAILTHVKPKWRTKENLTEIMPNLKFSCTRLCLAVNDITDFTCRSLSNAKRLPEKNIATRLHRLFIPVSNGSQIIQRDVDELDAYYWSVDRLSVSGGDSAATNTGSTSDALDQLILCSRNLKHDVTELANFLSYHSIALYKENDKLTNFIPKGHQPATHVQQSNRTSLTPSAVVESKVVNAKEDYDYVSLIPPISSFHAAADSDSDRSHSANSQILLSDLSSASFISTVSWHLDSKDGQLLEFYSAQITVTAPQLSQSISTFMSAIQQNEPPAVFNIHLKYVILFGYKFLFAGDTVHRNIGNQLLKREIELRANELHKTILALYEGSKVATSQFPKIGPMQAIVDRVLEITQAANELKKCILIAIYNSL